MKNRNRIRKAFTIVELVIVIAIIAVLAGVLVPTFVNLVKVAHVSTDTQLIRNLNTALAVDNKEHKTMRDALDAAAAAGYDVGKINATATGNEILWDSANDLFCYLEAGVPKPQYIPEFTPNEQPEQVQYWRITKEANLAKEGPYSVYYTGTKTEIETTVGFDAGTKAGIYVTYTGTQDVVIYTNRGTLRFSDTASGTVTHYGLVDVAPTIPAVVNYIERGQVMLAFTAGSGITAIPDGIFDTDENGNITGIKASAFNAYKSTLTSFNIPEGVTSIGKSAFNGCTALTTVTIPSTVDTIGQYAFQGCTALESVTIPDSVNSMGTYAFNNCSNLKNVEIGSGITAISNYAFQKCTSLESITIPNSVTAIGTSAFNGCTVLESVTIPDRVTSIGQSAFYGCSKLTNVTIPNTVSTISKAAFSGCTSLKSITIPDSVTTIDVSVFSGCTKLASVTIPDSVTKIDSNVFDGCTALTSITLPNTLRIIATNAFANSGITSIVIPASVTNVASTAFANCSDLTTITVAEENTTYKAVDDCLISIADNKLVLGCKNSVIPSYVTAIGDNAFRNCKALTGITIPGSITSIGKNAFDGCSQLTSVEFGEAVDDSSALSIGEYAFANSGLTSIEIPNRVTSIGNSIFFNCKALTTATLSANITAIPTGAFSGCTSLESITIPDNVTTIGVSAFQTCSALTEITIPENVISIGRLAFNECSRLTKATFAKTTVWKVSSKANATAGTQISGLSNSKDAATYLTSQYANQYWTRT